MYISGVCGDQERELQMVVDYIEVLGTEPSSLQKQPVLFTTEPSLQPLN